MKLLHVILDHEEYIHTEVGLAASLESDLIKMETMLNATTSLERMAIRDEDALNNNTTDPVHAGTSIAMLNMSSVLIGLENRIEISTEQCVNSHRTVVRVSLEEKASMFEKIIEKLIAFFKDIWFKITKLITYARSKFAVNEKYLGDLIVKLIATDITLTGNEPLEDYQEEITKRFGAVIKLYKGLTSTILIDILKFYKNYDPHGILDAGISFNRFVSKFEEKGLLTVVDPKYIYDRFNCTEKINSEAELIIHNVSEQSISFTSVYVELDGKKYNINSIKDFESLAKAEIIVSNQKCEAKVLEKEFRDELDTHVLFNRDELTTILNLLRDVIGNKDRIISSMLFDGLKLQVMFRNKDFKNKFKFGEQSPTDEVQNKLKTDTFKALVKLIPYTTLENTKSFLNLVRDILWLVETNIAEQELANK